MAVKTISKRKTLTQSSKQTTRRTNIASAKRRTSPGETMKTPTKNTLSADIAGRVRWDDTLEVVDNVDVALMVSDDSSDFTY